MKNTKENLLKVLKANKKNAHEMAEIYRTTFHDEAKAKEYIEISIAYYDVICMLEDEKYFNDMMKICTKKENK